MRDGCSLVAQTGREVLQLHERHRPEPHGSRAFLFQLQSYALGHQILSVLFQPSHHFNADAPTSHGLRLDFVSLLNI
jgi:hypothetical protein